MLRVVFEMREDCVNFIGRYFCNPLRSDIKEYPLNLTDFKYRNMFVIDYGRSTMTVGLCFNGTNRSDVLKGFLEFNPNKCMDSMQISADLAFLLSRCVEYSVVRWDLAIDVPVDRERVHMTKDRRKYELSQTSYSNRTEYLGQRNHVGRVKVYNKTAESDLDYALTRLEITLGKLDVHISEFEKYVPEIWIDNPQHELVDYTGLSDTQIVLCDLLRDSPNPEYYMARLSYRMRKKIEPYVIGSGARLCTDVKCVTWIVTQISDYLKEVSVSGNAQKVPDTEEELEKRNPFVDK